MDTDLLEAAMCGDAAKVRELITIYPELLNQGHAMNGWTALHWAAKRNQEKVVELLLSLGADASLETTNGEVAYELATVDSIVEKLGGTSSDNKPSSHHSGFTPNYIANPLLPSYIQVDKSDQLKGIPPACLPDQSSSPQAAPTSESETVLKLRLANQADTDFIEVDLMNSRKTLAELTTLITAELKISANDIVKIRKLPNTIIRRDKDVNRLKDYQEIEVVFACQQMKTEQFVASGRPSNPLAGAVLY